MKPVTVFCQRQQETVAKGADIVEIIEQISGTGVGFGDKWVDIFSHNIARKIWPQNFCNQLVYIAE